jgi:hypothetical protein
MTSDAACVEANVDYGNAFGYLVRLDVEIPPAAVMKLGVPSWHASAPA